MSCVDFKLPIPDLQHFCLNIRTHKAVTRKPDFSVSNGFVLRKSIGNIRYGNINRITKRKFILEFPSQQFQVKNT